MNAPGDVGAFKGDVGRGSRRRDKMTAKETTTRRNEMVIDATRLLTLHYVTTMNSTIGYYER